MTAPLEVGPERAGEVADVLAEAFFDYPVMRYVTGGGTADVRRRRQRRFVDFITAVRYLRGDTVLGLEGEAGGLAAVATLIPPRPPESPPALEALREELWRDLGDEARRRHQAFGEATLPFKPSVPHYYLAMIGVRRAAAGGGLGRVLLDAVHARSQSDPGSQGVALTTEDPANVPLYEHFGYRVLGRAEVGWLTSWVFFRPDPKRAVRGGE